MTLTAELYSGKCRIPAKFRLYHGGMEVDGLLKVQQNIVWGELSNHIFFSANMGYVQKEYLRDWLVNGAHLQSDGDLKEYRLKQLYVMDGRCLSSNSFVVTNYIGVWYDEIRCLEGFLHGFEELNTGDINSLQQRDSDYKGYQYERYLAKFPGLKTKEDFLGRLEEAKKEWFVKYCKPFNVMHMERYRKQDENIILVPGPVLINNQWQSTL